MSEGNQVEIIFANDGEKCLDVSNGTTKPVVIFIDQHASVHGRCMEVAPPRRHIYLGPFDQEIFNDTCGCVHVTIVNGDNVSARVFRKRKKPTKEAPPCPPPSK